MVESGDVLPDTAYDETQVLAKLAQSVPKTWDCPGIASAAEAAQEGLDEQVKQLVGSANVKHPVEEIGGEELAWKKVVESGKLDARSKEGLTFYRALKAEPELAEKYANVGRSYKAQREFRMQWCRGQYEAARSRRVKALVEWEQTGDVGEYCSFPRMVHREGTDKAAWRTSTAYVANCISKWLQGKTYRGMPYVKYVSMRQRAVFLHIRELVKSGNKTEHRLEQRSAGLKASSGSVSAPPTPVSAPPTPVPPAPVPVLKRKNAFEGEPGGETAPSNKKGGGKKGETGSGGKTTDKEVVSSFRPKARAWNYVRKPRDPELALSTNSSHAPQRS